MAAEGFIEPKTRTDHTRVERTALLREVDAELARSGIVVVCDPWGYGRSSLLRDYARIVHARVPSRPLVRVDFDTFEAQSFLNGSRGPLLRLLSRKTKTLAEKEMSERLRRLPARYSNNVTHLVYEHLAAQAPTWCAAYENGQHPDESHLRELPLVTIDNLPRMDEEDLGQFADALVAWAKAGARIVVACSPLASIPRSLLPEAFVVSSTMLSVSRGELAFWSKELRFPDTDAVARATMGVPLLVDACRAVTGDDPLFDEAFLRASGRVMENCLNETMCAAAERARWAMAMLMQGTLNDLLEVGAGLREDEAAIIAETYPLFGVDLLRGTFSCVPVACDRGSGVMLRIVGSDEVLAERCAGLLIERGWVKRAGEIAALMSEASRLRLLGHYPDVFADSANGGVVDRCLEMLSRTGGVESTLRPGLACLARLHAVAHDESERMIPDELLRVSVGLSEGALHAVRCVFGFWKSYGNGAENDVLCEALYTEGTRRTAGRPVGAPHGEGLPGGSEPNLAGLFPAGREEVSGVGHRRELETVVRALGVAGLQGNAGAYDIQLEALCGLVDFAHGGLTAAVFAFHAAVCGFLCDRAEVVLSWVESVAQAAADPSARPGTVSSISTALLNAARSAALLLVERPSAVRISGDALAGLQASRRFLDERNLAPYAAAVSLLEGVCMLLSGNERKAAGLMARCQMRWNVQGTLMGQLAANLALSAVNLAEDAVNQAAVHAQTAESLAQRLGVKRAVWLARLLGSVAVVRNDNAADIDRRLLEAALRQSALHPTVSVALNLELALLYAVRGDVSSAQDILHGVGLFARPVACRLLVTAVRALRREKSRVLDLLPRSLRLEYEGLRPSASLRLNEAEDPPPGGVAGLMALPRTGKILTVDLFGGLKVAINGFPVSDQEWGRRKARKLLAIIALHHDRPVSRDLLVEALWDERQVTSRNNLSTLLSSLRASLGQKGGGPEFLVTARDVIGLNPELVDVDVLRFERLARTVLSSGEDADPAEVVEACSKIETLYGTGFGPEFKDGLHRIYQRAGEMTTLFIDCMLMGGTCALERGDAQLALWFARAADRVAPHRDDVRSLLEETLYAVDRRDAVEVALDGIYEDAPRGRRPKRREVEVADLACMT